MKNRFWHYCLLAVVIAFTSFTVPSDNIKKEQVLLKAISSSLQTYHYSPQKLDDEFSQKAYKLYLSRIDYNKRFLLQEDVDRLEKYQEQLDDLIEAGSYEFFELSLELLEQRITEVEGFYQELLEEPFDFEKDESYETDGDKRSYAKTQEERREFWRKTLKYQTLTKLHLKMQLQEDAQAKGDTTLEVKTFEEMEKEAREKVKTTYADMFRRLKKVSREDRLSSYLTAITNVYDPHTSYFPPRDKENFDISISGKLEGIGAVLQEKDGYTKVVRIIPGSPSWKQGDLEANDLIIKVAQGDEEAVDVVDMGLDEVVSLIRGTKGTEVQLTVKKVDGSLMVIPIIRDEVNIEETFAKSAVLEKEGQRVGYILLPKFYTDFNDRNGRTCWRDVAQEIEKLQGEKIEGLILDLRNNGGGSLKDVIKMGGLFIKSGPIVQVKTRYTKTNVHSDRDPRVQYDGPFVIMVNQFSASASEILAAAMQDYGRAIIVGTPTFGKGTVQQFYDLDNSLTPQYSEYKPLGALKLTIQKFYRINGGSTQVKGVVPDIIFPDAYQYLEIGEKEYDYHMPWSEIEAAPYVPWKGQLNRSKVVRKSEKRIEKDENFRLVSRGAERMKEESDESKVPLNLTTYRQEEQARKKEMKQYEEAEKKDYGLHVSGSMVDDKVFETDTIKAEVAEKWFKNIAKDIYVHESFLIINDMQ